MKISKYTFLPIAISIILFLIPFFWFKPGEMDLGGDSSRLYFYDPASYLSNAALYVVSPSNFGAENLGYANLPFIFLLLILKSIGISPTILICMFYGISLSGAFIFTYLSIKELIDVKNSWLVAAVGGLVYTFSPTTLDGWKHVLITYNHIFLSPLIFYLLLRYFKTSNIKYIFVTILLTFVFSPNFSVSAAPSIFAFYPLSIAFLVLYTKLILKRHIIVRHIILGLLFFIGIQAFQLLPTVRNIFSSGSDINSTVFADKGKFDRGLSYFSAIAPSIKASLNLFGLPQMTSLNSFSKVFIVSPFIIVIAFMFKKNKTILLTAVFFVIVLFFVTANITNTWLFIYKWLFNVPGFSMFRNFSGQWLYMYIFFYSILFGQAFYIVLNKLSRIYGYLLVFLITTLFVINAMSLIKGDIVNQALWQSNNIKAVIKMDPDFEKALFYVKTLPMEARVLTLPLTDPGYQVIAGENGGAYMGSSTIAFLAGKKDFGSYDEFQDYKDLVLDLIKNNELERLKRILGILNIKYIFYNADPLVYDEFPSYPYGYVKEVLPKTQKLYKKLIKDLGVKEIKNIDNKFFVYELPERYYLPRIYTAPKLFLFNRPDKEIETPLSIDTINNRIAMFNSDGSPINPNIKFDEVLEDLRDKSSLSNVINSTNISLYGFPYASWGMDTLFYPYLISKENKELSTYNELTQTHIDRRIFFAEKRIAELQISSKKASVLGNVKSIDSLSKSWKEPTVLESTLFQKYNYWEVSLVRYERAMNDVIDRIEKVSEADVSFESNKDRIRKAINADRDVLYRTIQFDEKLTGYQKIYVLKLSIGMFNSLTNRLQFKIPDFERINFNLGSLEGGKSSILIDKKSIEDYNQSEMGLVINDNKLSFNDIVQVDDRFRIQKIIPKEKAQNSFTLLLPESANLILNTNWEPVEKGDFTTNSVRWTINDIVNEKNGLLREIGNWHEKSSYVLTFDYVTYSKGFELFLFDKTDGRDSKISYLLQDELRSDNWKKYTALVASSNEATSAYLQIFKPVSSELLNSVEPKGQSTKIYIRNLSVVRVPNPKIILRKTNRENKNIPQITFTRVNTTKYEVKVENATSPYTLVLINQFNKNWRIIDPTQDTLTVRAFFSRFIANMGKRVWGFLGNENPGIKNTQFVYFGGDIKENSSEDIFLNEKTFETWGKNEVAGYKHFPVNGYANAWYIEPKDMNGKSSYTIIIEMTSQKMLYLGLGISILTLILTIIVLIKSFLKNK